MSVKLACHVLLLWVSDRPISSLLILEMLYNEGPRHLMAVNVTNDQIQEGGGAVGKGQRLLISQWVTIVTDIGWGGVGVTSHRHRVGRGGGNESQT